MKMDRINLKLLAVLQQEGRITNQDLADRIGLSPSACLERVRKLEHEGALQGYQARVDLDKVCPSITVITTVTLHDHRKEHMDQFEKAICALPEVVECQQVSGVFDYMLRIVCRDMQRYQALSDELIEAGSGIIELSSHVVMDSTKTFQGFPLNELLQTN